MRKWRTIINIIWIRFSPLSIRFFRVLSDSLRFFRASWSVRRKMLVDRFGLIRSSISLSVGDFDSDTAQKRAIFSISCFICQRFGPTLSASMLIWIGLILVLCFAISVFIHAISSGFSISGKYFIFPVFLMFLNKEVRASAFCLSAKTTMQFSSMWSNFSDIFLSSSAGASLKKLWITISFFSLRNGSTETASVNLLAVKLLPSKVSTFMSPYFWRNWSRQCRAFWIAV